MAHMNIYDIETYVKNLMIFTIFTIMKSVWNSHSIAAIALHMLEQLFQFREKDFESVHFERG